jgi:dephospho-CoA kinase
MKKIGITGNMGSGKSLVCNIFEVLHIPVFYADREAKQLYGKAEIYEKMVKYFGKSIYNPDKKIKPTVLARKIFKRPEALEFVNSIIHPAVHIRFDEWILTNNSSPYILYEAAILFETGNDKLFDAVIVVTAPEHIRMERIEERDKLSVKEIKSRMARQWPEEMKTNRANFIIRNDGKTMVIPQVLKIHDQLVH